jgi:membrane protein implicated in regulation of membrane protease activity
LGNIKDQLPMFQVRRAFVKAFSLQYWFEKWNPFVRPWQSVVSSSNWQSVELFPTQEIAIVDVTISCDRPGRIKYQSSYWPARFANSHCDSQEMIALKPKEEVMVVGREGITLLVAPIVAVETV